MEWGKFTRFALEQLNRKPEFKDQTYSRLVDAVLSVTAGLSEKLPTQDLYQSKQRLLLEKTICLVLLNG